MKDTVDAVIEKYNSIDIEEDYVEGGKALHDVARRT